MKNSSDPSVHRQREQQLIQHVERLLNDDRLRVDTTRGNRARLEPFRPLPCLVKFACA